MQSEYTVSRAFMELFLLRSPFPVRLFYKVDVTFANHRRVEFEAECVCMRLMERNRIN